MRAAAVQAAPALLDLERSLERVESLLAQAAGRGATLVAFGETWLPGYPAWLDLSPGSAYWDHPPAKKVHARLRANSVVIPGPATERLARAARAHRVVLVIGVHERVDRGPGNGTLYNTQITFGPDGAILSTHRKLVPTHAERLVWGMGDGGGLAAVPTPAGMVGTLICWEHWMPLLRQAMHQSGEEIHVACWPTVRDLYQVASRHYAFEGRTYVLAVGQILRVSDLPPELPPPAELRDQPRALVASGGSCIIGPDGAILAGPIFDREEILIADLDLDRIGEESLALDVTGHYSRPDLFEFRLIGGAAAARAAETARRGAESSRRPPGVQRRAPAAPARQAGGATRRSSGGGRRRKAVQRRTS